MIGFFNRTVLYRDTDAEESARVWGALSDNGVPFEIKTKTGKGPVRRQFTQTANMKFRMGGIPAASLDGPEMPYLYTIYVRKKDLDRAKSVCGMK